MKNTIQIKSRWNNDKILYTGDGETLKEVLMQAVADGADLSGADLYKADLYRADLYGADLSGANLSGANLSRVDLAGAGIKGAEVAHLITSVSRVIDPYVFHAFEMAAGGVKVMAGCRWFTVEEFRAHVSEQYPDTPKARETLDILAFIETRAAALKEAM